MSKIKKDDFYGLAKEATTQPKEVLLKKDPDQSSFSLGIPKEDNLNEHRVPITPSAVKMLVYHGFEIMIESGAGIASRYSDNEYSEAGAQITSDKNEVYQADILLKIAFPKVDEIKLMKKGQLLISALNHPHLEAEYLRAFMDKKITALAFENIKDNSGILPIIHSMSEIAGKAAVFIAAEYLAGKQGSGLLFGGITGVPSVKAIILGAGTVGQFAARTSQALGAEVKVFDNSLYKLRRLRTFNSQHVFNSIIEQDILSKELLQADVVIGALRPYNGRTPCVVTEDMVMSMKENSVLIDVSIDQGGCFETSKVTSLNKPTFVRHGVTHYCVPNIPSIVPTTASMALSNILAPILTELSESNTIDNYLWELPFARHGIYMYKGILTNSYLGQVFNLNSKAIDILLTSNL
ncbi:MAG: alanine dehydrogenase [Bacteroidetes bacterium]|nr:alanine dehydrogenase [Bacteroidota bacterium]MBT5530890.1 alanine dehydrogenase [Cytophagia bacterium]MBT3421248.1 alanine dehydrogenase [Bacteroidota bacterium]MBT3933056.1 alanine dehydrogenase [Bacteroidota bacterium]MBT4729491.1 alanine dehydrogenase [Bacteroidota bacterium]